jgi:NitT/TauT family transport system permease protein
MRASKSWFEIRGPIGTIERIVLGIVPIVLILVGWWFITHGAQQDRIISSAILPSPLEVVKSFPSLWFQAELSRSAVASTWRVIQGFAVALLVAFPLGLLMGSFTRVRALFEPLSVFGAYLPIPALVPLTMSLFGVDESQKVMFLALAFFIFLLPMILRAVDEVDDNYLRTAYTLGATHWETIRYVLLGVSAPKIYQAMRLGFGIGWTYIILAEMVAAERGLGQIIIVAQRRGPREHIYLVLLVIVLIAYLTDRLWATVGKWLFPYQEV